MVKLVSAKCPNCGASLKLSKEEEKVECEYCHNTIVVDDAIACYKLKISGKVSVEGITTNADLIEAANELLDMKEFLKAKRKFLEFSEKCPDNYQGWLGLLICRTRNFTIRDNNLMFENDIHKYRDHFFRVAPDDIKDQYFEMIDRYFDPEKYRKLEEQERAEKQRQEFEEKKRKAEEEKKFAAEEKKKKKEKKTKEKNFTESKDVASKIKETAGKGANGFILVLKWALASILWIMGIGCILSIPDGLVYIPTGIIFVIQACMICPVITENTKQYRVYNKYKKMILLITVILFVITIILFPAANSETEDNISSNNNYQVSNH